MDEYTPDILEGKYARFLFFLEECHKCGRQMVVKPRNAYDIFPQFWRLQFEQQASNAGLGIRSNVKVDGRYICKNCVAAGRADFLCALCGERKPTDRIQESFGDPPEFMCIDCYETVPAKKWEAKQDELRDEHKWDFE